MAVGTWLFWCLLFYFIGSHVHKEERFKTSRSKVLKIEKRNKVKENNREKKQ
jgi:hypothetical protein